MSGIYKITNQVNGKKYVGSTKTEFSKRWGVHRCLLRNNKHQNPHLQRSWNKYGEQNFKMEPLEKVEPPIDPVLENRENYFIKLLNAEYNLIPSDRCHPPSFLGRHHTEETKKKLSMIAIGRKISDSAKEKISIAMSGQNHLLWGTHQSQETKEKNRLKHLGKPVSKTTREKIREKALLRPKGENQWNFIGKYRFFHPTYGEEILGQCELVHKYKNVPLDKGAINKICSSKLKQYKGWICRGKIT